MNKAKPEIRARNVNMIINEKGFFIVDSFFFYLYKITNGSLY